MIKILDALVPCDSPKISSYCIDVNASPTCDSGYKPTIQEIQLQNWQDKSFCASLKGCMLVFCCQDLKMERQTINLQTYITTWGQFDEALRELQKDNHLMSPAYAVYALNCF